MVITHHSSPDVQRLSALHAQCFARGWSAEEFADMLAFREVQTFVAEKYAGFGLLRIIDDEAEVLTLAVAGERQNQGIGKALMHSMLAYAREQGVKSVFLEVKEDNKAALALYGTLGFALMLRRKKYYRMPDSSEKDAIVMCKDLS